MYNEDHRSVAIQCRNILQVSPETDSGCERKLEQFTVKVVKVKRI